MSGFLEQVSYVLGTEDVFSRRRSHGKVDPKVAEVAEAKKSQAFNTWIERIAMIFGIEDGKEEDGQEGAGTDRGQFLMAAVENGADMSEHDDGEDGSHDDGEDDDDMEADDDVNGS